MEIESKGEDFFSCCVQRVCHHGIKLIFLMTDHSPMFEGSRQAIGLAWTIPVLLAIYLGLGYWVGGLLGSHPAGLVTGWILGMGAIFWEIYKTQRGTKPQDGAGRRESRGS